MDKSYTSKFKFIVKVLTLLMVLTVSNGFGQTIVSDNFENTTTLFSNVGGTYFSGNSAAGDRPATSPFAQSGTFGIGVSNGTAVFTSSLINTSTCTTPQLTLKLASFSIGSTGNGADGPDLVKIEISNNGGGSYVNTLEVDGNSNAYWSYASGTGVASTSFGTPAVFAPAGGGARTADGYSTLTITGLPTVANLVVRITLLNNSAGEQWVIDNFVLSGSCGGSNTITTGLISTPPFNLASCASTATGTAAFTSTGTFIAGNIYTAQLSDASGSFAVPVNIGTLTSIANSGTITFTVPAGTLAGAGYRIRIISSNPSTIGSNSSAFTITSGCPPTCPSITGALINACAGTCAAEGNNEMVFLSSGSYNIPVNSTNINITFGGVNFTSGFTAQPAVVSNLNTLAGCGSLFVDASSGTIPANSSFILMNNGSCFNYDFSTYCSSAPVYVIFSNSASWPSGGFFTNGGATIKSFVTDFSAINALCTAATYSYLPDDLINFAGSGDGGAISYSSIGGPVNYLNNGCTPPPTILPIQLVDFHATKNGKKNEVVWKVASEENVVYYTIDKSNDGINFTELATVFANNETQRKAYSTIDDAPFDDITYYRLGTKEKDGKVNYYKIISVDEKSIDWNSIHYQQEQNLVIEFKNTIPKNSTINLFDLSGKLLVEQIVKGSQTTINTQAFAEGIYFVKIATPYKTENFKIIITK